MKKIKAFLRRWRHCMVFTVKELGTDHRMETAWNDKGKTIYIGCACGKVFFRQWTAIHRTRNYK